MSCPTCAQTVRCVDAAATAYAGIADALERLDFASGFGAVWDLIRATNSFIEDRAPWALNKAGDTDAVARVIGDCLESLRIVALLASPVIPNAAARAVAPARAARAPEDQRVPGGGGVGPVARGLEVGEGRAAVSRARTR